MTKQEWRDVWLRAHRWLGLALAVPAVVLGLSGAALVWDGALDRLLHPARQANGGIERLTPGDYVAAATARLSPDERIATLTLPSGSAPMVVTTVVVAPGVAPSGRVIYLDPATARVLDVAAADRGAVALLRSLHATALLPGGWGRDVVGSVGLAMVAWCLSALALCWRPAAVVPAASGRRPPHLHRALGCWSALPLLIMAITGVGINFPDLFQAPAAHVAPGGSGFSAQARRQPVAATRLTVGEAVERAQALRRGEPAVVTWPTMRRPDWIVRLAAAGAAAVEVAVADDIGTAALVGTPEVLAGRRGGSQPGERGLLRRFHDGQDMSVPWRVLIFLAGLMPVVLVATRIMLWWRGRGRDPAPVRPLPE